MEVLNKNKKKFTTLKNRIGSWAKNKWVEDEEFFLTPNKEILKRLSSIDKETLLTRDFPKIDLALLWYGNWHFDKFIDILLNKNDVDRQSLTNGILARQLRYLIQNLSPKIVGPSEDTSLGLAVCDSIWLKNKDLTIVLCNSINPAVLPKVDPEGIISFSLELAKRFHSNAIYQNIKNEPKQPYKNLLNVLLDESSIIETVLSKTIDYRIENSKINPSFPFSHEIDIILPSEILAIYQLRKSAGLQTHITGIELYDKLISELIQSQTTFMADNILNIYLKKFTLQSI
ncbi:hypothetical protein [Lewinella sp. IMCC34191]|uniref:hypothetical protein n=1 Tax=Lewinella sp. IMCC34191 TaxID=2259172 RepID=UPI000E256E01|nr:hypothetical protein [Lewinella sp. IMCC34191]